MSFLVSSLLLTPSILAVGLYGGEICIYHTPTLLDHPEENSPIVLHGHFNRVYALHSLKGHISTDGSSSLFPTYLGHAADQVEKDYLVSVGFGRGYPSLKKNKVFRKSSAKRGSFINVWLL